MADGIRAVLRAGRRALRSALDALRRSHVRHRLGRLALWLSMVTVTLVGVSAGLLLAGPTHDDVGPFAAQFALTPSVSGGTDVQIPPIGSLDLATHKGPAHLTVRLDSLDQKRTLALATDPNGITKASQGAVGDVERGLTRLVFQSTGAAMLGALLLSSLVYRNMRRVAICGGLSLLTVLVSGGIAAATFRAGSVEEPRYRGLLSNAPAVIGDARRIANNYGQYRDELQRLVNNVGKLYGTVSTLPVFEPTPGSLRVLHISDLHLNPAAWSIIDTVVKQYNINMVIDTGDINDWGTQVESSFVDSIGSLGVPYVYIRGNHDSAVTAAAVARQPNAIVLENQVRTVLGLTVAGIGDPRFTPDKATPNPGAAGHQEADIVEASGEKLAATIEAYRHQQGGANPPGSPGPSASPAPSASPGPPSGGQDGTGTAPGRRVDVALVHDPASDGALDGVVPLVLAGHLHARHVSTMPKLPGEQTTLVMVEGSTGGAGLRGLEGEAPTPLEMSVLYFDPQHDVQAYDEITLGGTGQTEVTIQRHLVKNVLPTASTTPSPSGS
jgi:predicted MPP superfamily phosphohydrolase